MRPSPLARFMEPIFGRFYGPPPRRRRGKRLVLVVGALVAAVSLSAFFSRELRPALLEPWVASPGFNGMLSKAVSSALKVDGEFGLMKLGPGLSVTTEGFASRGWPGQAIGGLDTGQATGWFNPWGMLRRTWQVDLITISEANFRLVQPDDSLKAADPPKAPRPWYAALMPQNFHCRWIDCADMRIELPVGAATVQGSSLQVGAMMIGKNFKYFGRNGILRYPGYAEMAVDAMEVYVTREAIDIGYLYLREPASPQSNLKLSGRMGQHADRSIAADVEVTGLDITPFLPGELAAILRGKLSGRLAYRTDAAGQHPTGEGALRLDQASLANWDYLYGLAKRAANPALGEARFRNVELSYTLADDVFSVHDLQILGEKHFQLSGSGQWEIGSSHARAEVQVRRIPLEAYLPASLVGKIQGGELGGDVDWTWRGADVGQGRGFGNLSLTSALLRNFKFQRFLGRFLKTSAYEEITVATAKTAWKQDPGGLLLHEIDILAPGQAGLRGWVHAAPDGTLSGTVLAGLPAEALAWLPDATTTVFPESRDGLHWCTIQLSGTVDQPQNNFTEQAMKQLRRHPLALSRLVLRGLSWWLGDVFGEERGS